MLGNSTSVQNKPKYCKPTSFHFSFASFPGNRTLSANLTISFSETSEMLCITKLTSTSVGSAKQSVVLSLVSKSVYKDCRYHFHCISLMNNVPAVIQDHPQSLNDFRLSYKYNHSARCGRSKNLGVSGEVKRFVSNLEPRLQKACFAAGWYFLSAELSYS